MKPIWVGVALVLIACSAAAQKVYRCGPDGRIYQQAPCADGTTIDAGDPRTPEQRAAAQAVAASEARRAAQFDRDNAPHPAPEGRRAKPPKAPGDAAAGKAASAADPASQSASAARKGRHPVQDPSHPITVRLPKPPKASASAASAAPAK